MIEVLKKNRQHYLFLFVVLGATLVFFSIYYGKAFVNPNSYLFSANGDGMKNYYTYAYFIENNSSNIEFEGMNYPYGENFMYTDCHPLQATVLKHLVHFFPGLSKYSIGILNFFMLLSIGFTTLILFLILMKLKVDFRLAVLGAIAITFLSPQILRMTGHYALSYSFVIPLTIYLLLVFEENEKRFKTALLLILSILVFFFTHGYLGMIAATLVFAYAVIGLINQYLIIRKESGFKYLQLLLTAIVPIVVFYVFVKIIDSHIGRTTNPSGIFRGHADLNTVFLPRFSGPMNDTKQFFFGNIHQTWEGLAYIGFPTIVALFLYGFRSIKASIETRRIALDKIWIDYLPMRQLLVASVLILLFSMLLPFRSVWFDFIDKLSIIKQFRALGRFAWVFYFTATLALFYILNTIIRQLKIRKKNTKAFLLLIFVPLFLVWEAFYYHTLIGTQIKQSSNLFDLNQTSETFRDDCLAIPSDKYQAILPLPFFYIGSENFGKGASDEIYHLSFLFSYHLKLPMFGSYLTRTSILESKNIMQLLANNYYKKSIEQDLPNDKPFLIVSSNQALTATEANILNKAKLLVKRDNYSLYEVSTRVFFENTAQEEYNHFRQIQDSLFYKNGFFVSDTSLFFSFVDFDQNKELSFGKQNGCYKGLQKKFNLLYQVDGSRLEPDRKYVARFWMYNSGPNFGQDCMKTKIFFEKEKGDKTKWLTPVLNAGTSHQINNNWSMVELFLDNIDQEASYKLVMKGDEKSDKPFYVDRLLFYDSQLKIYRLNEEENTRALFYNNHEIELPESGKKSGVRTIKNK